MKNLRNSTKSATWLTPEQAKLVRAANNRASLSQKTKLSQRDFEPDRDGKISRSYPKY